MWDDWQGSKELTFQTEDPNVHWIQIHVTVPKKRVGMNVWNSVANQASGYKIP